MVRTRSEMVVMAGDHKIHMEDVLQTDAALRVEIQTKDSCIEAQAIELARLRALIDEVTTSRAQTASLATEIRHENARLKKENQMLEEATLALRA